MKQVTGVDGRASRIKAYCVQQLIIPFSGGGRTCQSGPRWAQSGNYQPNKTDTSKTAAEDDVSFAGL
jgi:hypothetical protein